MEDSSETRRGSTSLNQDTIPPPPPLSPAIPPSSSPQLKSASGEEETVNTAPLAEVEDTYQSMLTDPYNMETRFAVDRRKLERLIIAGKDDKSAEEFFRQVMDRTGTVILWPSKLKIGAKSKKDPQVKVAGPPEGVSKARDIILEELDTRNNRVTVKINIANCEHSHVIGREGTNIRKVHQDTQCHIHFPDSNRYSQGEKSDQVSITGLLPAVEMARTRVRDLQPAVISLTLPLPGHMTLDPQSPDMIHISETYNVSISIKPHQPSLSMIVTVRGTMRLIDGLKLAVVKLIEYVTGDYQPGTEVTLFTDIATTHQRTVMGMDGGNLQNIMHQTCTTIQFPDPHSRYRSSQISIIGSMDNVFEARQRLMGCLPVALLFDVVDEREQLTSGYLGELMQSLDIYISVKPKVKLHSQSIIIKSIEQNIDCVYEARQKIIELASFMPHPSAHATQIPLVSTVETTPPEEPRLLSPVIPELEVEKPGSGSEQTRTRSSISRPSLEQERETGLQASLNKSQGRITVKSFIDYEQKREIANKAKKGKIEPDVPRYPTNKWSGDFFSTSMPPAPRGEVNLSLSTVPKGLESLNRSSINALMKQATVEREHAIIQEQSVYQDIKDLSSLLVRLGLEKYESNFAEEEVDFDTFLTMTEEDLKEVGVATLGARRRLQIAIAEIRKLRSEQPSKTIPSTKKPSAPFNPLNQSSRSSDRLGVHLAPSYMSRSVRF